jgi:beta-galactosidase
MSGHLRHVPIVPRVPHLLHGADYNPDQWIPCRGETWHEGTP